MYILALSSIYLPIPRLMMKNERVLHMLPPHIGLPPTPDRFSDYKQLLLLLHNINGRRRPTVWDLSGSFIYNFFFFFFLQNFYFSSLVDFVDASVPSPVCVDG
jgi:hypothetical protein